MPRPADYRANEHITTGDDPYTRPAFSFGNRAARLLWNITWLLLYRPAPRPLHRWRAMLLRLFGATLGPALDGVGSRHDRAWLEKHFADPPGVVKGSIMPPYKLMPMDLDALCKYLLQLPPKGA